MDNDQEAALETAAKDRHLVETHFLEIKRELPPGSDSANKELARDLASLAMRMALEQS